MSPGWAEAQKRTVTGVLRPAEAGVPFAGAAVTLLGSDQTVCAAPDGRFSVRIPATGESRLRIQPVGFEPFEVTVHEGRDDVSLALPEHVVVLRGVTVTAFAGSGSLPHANTVLAGNDVYRAPSASIEGPLQARVPGADVRHNSGAPGGGFRLDLRGVRTILGSSEPLVVVDGTVLSNARVASGTEMVLGTDASQSDVANRLADLNPADVERVEVVKGSAATLRYGPRAANGVVSITTHRGRYAPAEAVDEIAVAACFRPVG